MKMDPPPTAIAPSPVCTPDDDLRFAATTTMSLRTVDPSAPDYAPPQNSRKAAHTSGSGRRPSQNTPTYQTLKDLGIQVAGRTVDTASLPLRLDDEQQEVLALDRVCAELLREDGARGLYTYAASIGSTCASYDLAVNEAGLGDDLLSHGDFAVVQANMHRLVGRLVLLAGQVRKTVDVVQKRSRGYQQVMTHRGQYSHMMATN